MKTIKNENYSGCAFGGPPTLPCSCGDKRHGWCMAHGTYGAAPEVLARYHRRLARVIYGK